MKDSIAIYQSIKNCIDDKYIENNCDKIFEVECPLNLFLQSCFHNTDKIDSETDGKMKVESQVYQRPKRRKIEIKATQVRLSVLTVEDHQEGQEEET